MDINCGEIVDGTVDGRRRWASASSSWCLPPPRARSRKSEQHGYGQNEFVPWQVGAVM